jgi:TetR/AcrR family transcriptional repressor of nem operon
MQQRIAEVTKESLPPTGDLILDVAQDLLQTRGYNAISYQDIADRIGIRKASIHHHFRNKSDLAHALVRRYRQRWDAFLKQIDAAAGADPWLKLQRYLAPFQQTAASGDRACLCGVLGAEFASLTAPVQAEVRGFFQDNEAWLTRLLTEGSRAGAFHLPGDPASEAGVLFACLEGTLFVARACGEPGRFDVVVRQLKEGLKGAKPRARSARTTPRRRGR